MKVAAHILEELRGTSEVLAGISNKAEFYLPDGYFDFLADEINIRKNFPSSESLTVPKNYFENLSDQILHRIHQEDFSEEKEFAVLSQLKKKPTFQIPENYFEKNPSIILEKCREQKRAKIVSIKRKIWAISAAAMIILIFSIGIFNWNIFGNKDSFKMAAKYHNEEQIMNGIDRLKSDEIASYLETHGNVSDNSLLISNDDADELPSTEDYLFNENSLHDYLKSIGGSVETN